LNSRKRILFLGCGDIAQRVAARLSDSTYHVEGLRRSQRVMHGIQMHVGNCCEPLTLNTLIDSAFDIVVVTMTSVERSEAGYRNSYYRCMEVLLTAIDHALHKPPLIIFVSSTSVYGQNKGEWVNEASATEPTSFSGRVLLETESLLQQSGVPHCIVRCSGIYGPARTRLIERVINGASETETKWTNRIHSEDCARFLQCLISMDRAQLMPLYLVTDSTPALSGDVESYIAGLLAQEAYEGPVQKTIQRVDAVNKGASGKQCSNQRVLDLGFNFEYTDYRDGYASLIIREIDNMNCSSNVIE